MDLALVTGDSEHLSELQAVAWKDLGGAVISVTSMPIVPDRENGGVQVTKKNAQSEMRTLLVSDDDGRQPPWPINSIVSLPDRPIWMPQSSQIP